MEPEFRYFSSQEVSNLLGVHVSTIKRWTEQGELDCIRTAGGHRKFMLEHIAEFLENHEDRVGAANLFPIDSKSDLEISYHLLKGDFEYLRQQVLEMALQRKRDSLQQVLNGLYLGQRPLHEIYDKLITPVLHTIGVLWETTEISVIEEHIASQTIRDGIIRLQGNINLPSQFEKTVLCITLSNELHDIALKMVDHILEEKGFNVLYSGQLTPMYNIDTIFQKFDVDRVYLSSTYSHDVNLAQFELNYLIDQCETSDTRIFVGGRGFEYLQYSPSEIVSKLDSFEEIYNQ